MFISEWSVSISNILKELYGGQKIKPRNILEKIQIELENKYGQPDRNICVHSMLVIKEFLGGSDINSATAFSRSVYNKNPFLGLTKQMNPMGAAFPVPVIHE